jgi:hypothetical protein
MGGDLSKEGYKNWVGETDLVGSASFFNSREILCRANKNLNFHFQTVLLMLAIFLTYH